MFVSSDGSFSLNPTDAIGPGLFNFGCSTGNCNPDVNDPNGGLIIPDASLRSRSRLAVSVAGNITGNIEVGQLWRIQAGLPGTTPTGIITANLTAVTPDGLTVRVNSEPFRAIEVIASNDLISGNITATGALNDPPQPSDDAAGTIGRIVVGPASAARGITGNISAPVASIEQIVNFERSIGSIFSTGPIGSPTSRVSITAGSDVQAVVH